MGGIGWLRLAPTATGAHLYGRLRHGCMRLRLNRDGLGQRLSGLLSNGAISLRGMGERVILLELIDLAQDDMY